MVSPENETKLANSVKELGQFKPVIVRSLPDGATDYEILGGEHRWQNAKAAGDKTIMILDLGEVDDIKAKKISIADNARYGTDDIIELSKLLETIGSPADLQEILPYTAADINALRSASHIALDDLELPEDSDVEAETPEAKPEKAPKTHTIMRFKVPIGDAERLTERLTKIQKAQGFTASDELTNAGDALVFALSEQEPA